MSLASKLLSASGGGVDKLFSDDVFSCFTYTGNGATQTINNGIALGDTKGTTDQQAYTTPGTYSWVCPAGVTSVSVLVIGGGGGGSGGAFSGGGGGGLRYYNSLSVIPGNSYSVVVGAGGSNNVSGGASVFNTTTLTSQGGTWNTGGDGSGVGGGGTTIGGPVGGGNGGNGSALLSDIGGGGGGAGGYAGSGGAAGVGGAAGSPGSGGGGGGGASRRGGGVGLLGEGSSGAGGGAGNDGSPGSGGSGILYGGGGGANSTGAGGGAVRIIWPGSTRTFPSTNTGDVTPVGIVAGKGGLVWIKARDNPNGAANHFLRDTVRGGLNVIFSNITAASNTLSTGLTFNLNGFTTNSTSDDNYGNIASWTFAKAKKFFDIVTYTGDGVAGRQIPHALGIAPGMVATKSTSVTGDWNTFHQSATGDLSLNTTAAQTASRAIVPAASATTFTVSGVANTSGATFVAYLFAHDPSADGIIQCGSFTTDASGNATVNLGWEPQFLLTKCSDTAGTSWQMVDMSRGMVAMPNYSATLSPNTSGAEAAANIALGPTATGFASTLANLPPSKSQIYLAIRRPNKPPTTGTQVFHAYTSIADSNVTVNTGFDVDTIFETYNRTDTDGNRPIYDRLRGDSKTVNIKGLYAESTSTRFSFTPLKNSYLHVTASTSGYALVYALRRAPSVYDVVCRSGTGSEIQVAHSLGVIPELIITKPRTSTDGFSTAVYHKDLGSGKVLIMETDAIPQVRSDSWGAMSATAYTVKSSYTNFAGDTVVDRMFATLAGISKVGSYTGNGTSQTLDMGFTTGARFFLVKATSTTGSWWIFDSTRGIIAAADPVLQLNSTAAEITSADAIDPASVGLVVNQEATCSINASGVSYIFLSFA